MTEQVFEKIEITSSNRKGVLGTNKVGSIIYIVEDIWIVEVILESIYNNFSWLRSRIQSI